MPVTQATQIQPLWTDCVHLQQEQLEKALSSAAEKGKLQEQVKRSVAEGNTYSYQLAHLHEERDKALVEMSRLEEVAPLARKDHGHNKRMVSQLCSQLHPFITSPFRPFTIWTLHHFTTSPLHHFTTSSFRPFTTSPLHHFTTSPFRPSTTSALHHFDPSPLHPFTTSSLHHFTISPFHPFTTSPSSCILGVVAGITQL